MKKLPSKLFPFEFNGESDEGFYDIEVSGFEEPISIYLGTDTVQSDKALKNAANFFDRIHEWDTYCKKLFLTAHEELNDTTIIEYLDFFVEEYPEMFNHDKPNELSLKEKIDSLYITGMASHNEGKNQILVVDFTLEGEQLLSVSFNEESHFSNIAWES